MVAFALLHIGITEGATNDVDIECCTVIMHEERIGFAVFLNRLSAIRRTITCTRLPTPTALEFLSSFHNLYLASLEHFEHPFQ